jgi:Cu+-exporting ATPase
VTGSVERAQAGDRQPRIMARPVSTPGARRQRRELRRDGATAIFVAIDGKAAGVIAIADP